VGGKKLVAFQYGRTAVRTIGQFSEKRSGSPAFGESIAGAARVRPVCRMTMFGSGVLLALAIFWPSQPG
jgi:hypothetical protein